MRNYNVPNGVEIANKLLDEAGFKRGADGIRFEIVHDLTPYGEEWRASASTSSRQLAKLGIKATLRYEDVATWLRRVYTNYDFQLTTNWIQTPGRPGDRRPSPLPLQADPAGHGVRQRLALEHAARRTS